MLDLKGNFQEFLIKKTNIRSTQFFSKQFLRFTCIYIFCTKLQLCLINLRISGGNLISQDGYQKFLLPNIIHIFSMCLKYNNQYFHQFKGCRRGIEDWHYFCRQIDIIFNSINNCMKSGFIELVVKRAMGGAVHNLPEKAPRYRAVESFKNFINKSLPQMQQAIEIELLKKNLTKIKEKPVRKELINSYLRRLFRLRTYEKPELKNYKELTAADPELIATIIDPTIFKPVNQHSQYDVGQYCRYTEADMNKVFKHGSFGLYSDEQFGGTRKCGIQIREESVQLGKLIKLINGMKPVDWSIFPKMEAEEIQQYINDQNNYPSLFMELSQEVYQHAQQYRSHAEYYRVWGSSIVTDVIVNSILQDSEAIKNAVQNAKNITDEVMKCEPLPSPLDFAKRFRTMPGTQIPTKNQLPENARFFCRTPSLKSMFLGGEGGTGKSMILLYLSLMAHKNGWIVVNLPNAYKWTHDTKAVYPRAYNGLYLINQHAVEWLDQFATANTEHLQKHKVDMNIFGKYDITGVREDEADPVPNIYYADRKTYFNEVSDKFKQRTTDQLEQQRKDAKKRITDVLKNPKNILSIAEAGIKNPQYATCAMGEILGQVYNLDTPILECVDSFSYLYRASFYPSFRYYNDRDLYGKIPPYHIAHCRMFTQLDGHKLKKGFKVVASSNYPMFKHKFDIKKIMFPENYEQKVRNLTPQEFRNAAQFNILNNWWMADEIQRLNLNYSYIITQGNWGDFQQLIRLGHYY